jgi:hypothetical protein
LVAEAALDYLVSVGDEDVLLFFDKIGTDGDPTQSFEIQDARLRVLTQLQPEKAFSEVLAKDEYLSDRQLGAFETVISDISSQTLLKGADNSWEQIRKLSLKELLRRHSLPLELAQKLTEDSALPIRALAYQGLAEQGALPDFETVRKALKEEESTADTVLRGLSRLSGGFRPRLSPDANSIIVAFYRTQPTARLREAIDWFSIDGPLAYRALALDRFDTIATELRTDLANGFERIKKDSIKRDNELYGAERGKMFAAVFEQYEDFIKSQFLEAALIGLAEKGQPGDAMLARPYLTHMDTSLRDPAVRVISKFGTSEDAATLLKVATESYGDIKEEAAAAALKLSSDPLSTARELIRSNSTEVVEIAFRWLFTQDSPDVKKSFEELLNDESDINRVRAIRYFSRRWNAAELEEFLREYIARGTYYYNVVTWLDRLLYSPSPLRDMYVKSLEQSTR